ncbi:MAG TPA: hypothetical protein VGJ06_04620 [Candidatus Acidoferrum sp.]|jgi:hypothetical protein
MKKRVFFCAFLMLISCFTAAAQQAQQPLTFWYEYHVNPGKEEEFLNLVKTVGAPVRDKLMADGVVLAWGVESPVLRIPDSATHMIWYAVADYAGLEKVDAAMREQISKMTEDSAKGSAVKKGAAAAGGPTERVMQITDFAKTHDYLTRDLVSGFATSNPPAGTLPFTRYAFVKAKPGKGQEYRKAWEKYNKPIFDKLAADGTILAFGLAVEDVRTDGDFTHYTWIATKDLASMDKVRAAVLSDRDKRSPEERDALTALFASLTDPDAARAELTRSLIFHLPTPK